MRLIELRSDVLDSRVVALAFTAREDFSQEPSYRLDLLSSDPELDLDSLLGGLVSADIDLDDGMIRTFNTYVFGGYDTGQLSGQYTYTLELKSWLSFLEENQNSRIFQNLTVPQIVEQVFQGHQRTDYRFELEGAYDVREYCVQFQESDLNFVKRLLEDEGIYFWVEHELFRHVVVLSDTQRFRDLPFPYRQLRYLPDGEESRAIWGREGVQRLQKTRRVRPNNVALRDFNYLAPSNRLDSDAQISPEPALSGVQLEYYDYAAGYQQEQTGERLARLRLEAFQAEAHVLTGEANARALGTGQAFTLGGYPAVSRNRRYYVIGSELSFIQDGPDSTSQGRNVVVKFRALADNQPYRPALVTRRPQVPGIQSATVVGSQVSEVYTDRLGRIKVHFHWDRYKTVEADASCWIRVSQAWAGKGWGVLALPRVGQEVLVTYVDGDLDRPVVTGVVYNGENPTPYDLPKDARYTGLVSRSIKQAGQAQNGSQLTFDDQYGAERLMLHSERDMQQTVERNSSIAVGQDFNTSIVGTNTSVVGTNISYTGTAVSYTGVSVGYAGVSTSFTGVNTSCVGVSTSYTGVSTSFTGVETGFVGVSTSFTGISTGFTGVSTQFTGADFSVHGSSTSVTGVSNSMCGISSSLTGTHTSVTGQEQSIVGVSLSYTGVSNHMTGTSASVTGTSTNITGTSVSNTETEISVIGTSASTVGTSTSVTGVHSSTTDSSFSVTGSSTSLTGNSFSLVGLNYSCVGVGYANLGVDLNQVQMQILN
ncbi:type VI secretion system tip protein VgrG (plasmid) [Burkholderia sp. FERM BP-3421]|uniref:type VI secretion system Vgr family protein n=1 Tax=Burkholderia sp. FERM BP-3421 TaxID=1494466 RepID=UPI00236114FB|nr:type VI secretion system tip protein VgrG [Burkholderia sp. FERM BP-3421]WDD90226.1 type VI secretion system tip protein VgrG [Burkholderia sp. FERM BP-3421]